MAFAALDDQRFTTKPVRVYLHVNGKPLSSPGNRTSVRCGDPGDLSLDHIMTVSASPHDYACIKIAHFASQKDFQRDSVGQSIIYVKDVVEYKITEHNSAQDVRGYLHSNFGAKPIDPAYKLSVVALTTSKVWIDIPRPALTALRRLKKAPFNQLDALNNMKYDDAGKAKLVLSFPQEEDDIRCNLISALLGREANLRKEGVNYPNPLDFWFQEENGGRRETLFPSHVGHKDDFPKLATSMKVSRYLTHDQQLVHQMVGSTYDETLQVDQYSELRTTELGAYLIQFPYADECQFLMFIKTDEKHPGLPRAGESCRVSIASAKVIALMEPDEIIEDIIELIEQARAKIDPVGAAIRLVSPYFKEGLSRDLATKFTCRTEEQVAAMHGEYVGQEVVREELEKLSKENELQPPLPVDEVTPAEDMETGPDDVNVIFIAHRWDISAPVFGHEYQMFIVTKPSKSPWDKKPIQVQLPFIQTMKNESVEDFRNRLFDTPMVKVSLSRMHSDRTLKAEALAINCLRHPKSRPQEIAATEDLLNASKAKYTYQLQFNDSKVSPVDILARLPALGRFAVEKGQDYDAPVFCREIFRALDSSKKRAFCRLSKVPAGLAFMNGVAGSGKSTFFQTIILLLFFALCDKEATVKTAIPADKKVLYVVNNNSDVDNFAQEGMNKQTSLHLEHPVPFLRLYSMESEIGTYMKKTSAQRDDALADSNAAAEFCDSFTDEPFLAELAIGKIGKDMKAAQEVTRAEKARHRGISLEAGAAQYFERHRDEFPALAEILQQQQTDGVIDEDTRSALKTLIRNLYTTFLGQFSGVIVTTPVAASNHLVHGSFKPDIVLVDEAGRLREMSLMISMTWYDAPHIVIGDHLQFGPHLTIEHHVQNGLQSDNPFALSITNSTLSRAVHAGETLASLTVNHRQLGDLYQLPSQLFYYNQVQPFLSALNRSVPAVKAFAKFIMTLRGEVSPSTSKKETSRLLVELPGSQARKAGSSTYNSAHAEWVLDRVKEILDNPEITNSKGNLPAGILIIPLYVAQVNEYRLRIKKLVNAGKWTEDDAKRVEVCTLDGAQGHERDISIVDFTQTSEPGFTADPRRLLVALTRGIIGEIVIMNRGMFYTWDTGKRSTDAYMLHRVHSKIRAKAALRVVCCPVHETYRHKFDDGVCKTITAKPMGEDHKSCDDTTHSQGACPKRKCRGCGMIGHLANECRELHCSRCQESGHLSWDCKSIKRFKGI